MNRKRPYFQSKFRNSSFGTNNSKENDRDPAAGMDRVQMLSKNTIDFVRSGQVIGSQSRAIEELVRNSIVHGKATVVDVTIGRTKTSRKRTHVPSLQVKDNGIGIDSESVEKFIGTHYCTFQHGQRNLHEKGGFGTRRSSSHCKGESLKSLASLCLEMQIETCFEVQKPRKEKPGSSSPYFAKKRNHNQYAPTKRRRTTGQQGHGSTSTGTGGTSSTTTSSSTSSSSDSAFSPTAVGTKRVFLVPPAAPNDQQSCSYLTHCTKIVQNGTMKSFKSSHPQLENHKWCSSVRKHSCLLLGEEGEEEEKNKKNKKQKPPHPGTTSTSNTSSSTSSTSTSSPSNTSCRRREQAKHVVVPCLSPQNDNSSSTTGTRIKIHGLFHNHEVRRKHDNLTSDLHSSKGAGIIKARNCIQILALAFPTVSIRLYFEEEIVVSWNYRGVLLTSPPLLLLEEYYLGSKKHQGNKNNTIASKVANNSSSLTKSGYHSNEWTEIYLKGLRERVIQLCGGDNSNGPCSRQNVDVHIDIVSKSPWNSTLNFRYEGVKAAQQDGAFGAVVNSSTSSTITTYTATFRRSRRTSSTAAASCSTSATTTHQDEIINKGLGINGTKENTNTSSTINAGGSHDSQLGLKILSASSSTTSSRTTAKNGGSTTTSGSIGVAAGEKNQQEWNLYGILYLNKEVERGPHRNNGLIFLNGRVTEYPSALADRIRNICCSHHAFGNCGKQQTRLMSSSFVKDSIMFHIT